MAHLFCRNTEVFKKWKTRISLVVYALIIFCVFGFCVSGRTNVFSYSSSEYKVLALKAKEGYLQQLSQNSDINKIQKTRSVTGTRRVLGWPGSSPPRCTSKCGRCTPCKPVHVTVPPGTPVTTEYYPEAWRCKCGNRLYMP
ncbi:EPIDERMAL PATTERNING FACTOR-like protein 6 [Dorcoceras hygrometricum]|uniref:Epidermal patterning factor-like protein n=1 Tax=Dorcoceras hygrometricum TaxID=472368 RepID=A0A2Z7AXV6_9LAMI|nr:EPIDERMAL PATTERNING FACTOR-like protein 6 [Dorcoceras hygrometricum]